jgi:hypothetical protein
VKETAPAIPVAAQIETLADGAPVAEAISTPTTEASSSVPACPPPPVDEVGAMRERRRIERGEPQHPYAEGVASEQYKKYVNQLIAMAGLEPLVPNNLIENIHD